ncbi:hypothetical protein LTS14_002578 [Recurvomyces mirabilis]|uniref:uncharacterized protein n=1 Tax=Recurvomyces mirabilis TaxID=574656 RepID=UPI002DE0CC69|nr:hypothetical protein LTS14_002578 [Recurvomyces mirabilis]
MELYGKDNKQLDDYIESFKSDAISVELIEVFRKRGKSHEVVQESHADFEHLKTYLCRKAPSHQVIRVLSVTQLSGPLIRLLGSKYEMDYELWTSQFQSSDREWFAGPLIERGARRFSHFNLSCVDFKRATPETPPEYQSNRRISHTVRLVRLLNLISRKGGQPVATSRVFVIRRISGHIRKDEGLWTFIYFCYPNTDLADAHLVTDIPGGVQPHFTTWITDFLQAASPTELLDDLSHDGYGFVLRVLREIKTTWKLLLNEMEVFLEDLNGSMSDDELMDSATWLHRQFISNLDYFQRQLLYHQRYVTYLMNAPAQEGLCIAPTVFGKDLLQENNALRVVDQRLAALRTQTTAILNTVVNLSAVQQARLAQEMTLLQRKDAILTFNQGESIRRLTILNMIYLPATFIATVFGMNIVENNRIGIWRLWTFALISVLLTAFTLCFAIFKVENTSNAEGSALPGLLKGVMGADIEPPLSSDAADGRDDESSSAPNSLSTVYRWLRSLRVELGRSVQEDSETANGDCSGDKALVRALCFYNDPPNGESPRYVVVPDQTPGIRNYSHHKVLVSINDVRGSRQRFTLESNSFAPYPNTFKQQVHIDYDEDDDVRGIYLPWVGEFVRASVVGDVKVLIWDYTVRKASKIKRANRQVNKIHIDQSIAGALGRARRHLLPEEAEKVLAGRLRFRIINVWKPIRGPVLDHPMVFADHRSIMQKDLVAVPQIYPDYVGETYALSVSTATDASAAQRGCSMYNAHMDHSSSTLLAKKCRTE